MVFNYICEVCNIRMDLNSKEQHDAGRKHQVNLTNYVPNNDEIKTANPMRDNNQKREQKPSQSSTLAQSITIFNKTEPESGSDPQVNPTKKMSTNGQTEADIPTDNKKTEDHKSNRCSAFAQGFNTNSKAESEAGDDKKDNLTKNIPSENQKESSNKQKQEQKPSRSLVYVQGYPRYTTLNDILKVLSPYGTLKCEKLRPDFAIVKFHDPKGAEAAVKANKKIILYGTYLTLTHFTPRPDSDMKIKQNKEKQFSRSKQKEIITDPKDLDLGTGFDQQCSSVLASIRLTFEEVENISRLYQDLQGALQALWPGCAAVPFGSITTGLGIKSSDADCFINIPENQRRYAGNHVSKAKKVLSKYPQIFSEVFAIPRANTPIVKFFHIPTETNCDVSFKTPLGARNSSLLSFLLRSDPRILPLCVLIKYWFKTLNLTGTGRLSNYALSMLVIFYLQQDPAPILPSVKFLQRGVYFVDCWNTAFMDQHNLLPPCTNSVELKHLLGGFFKFYRDFNFDDFVVSPYLGWSPKKCYFEDTASMDDVFALYKHNVANEYARPLRINTPMCVQDPFEQCHNVACSVGQKLQSEITQCIKWAADIYEKDLPNNCDNFLKNILLQKPKIEKLPSNAVVKISLADGILRHLANEGWIEKVKEAFNIIFEKILKFKLTKENLSQDQSTQGIEIYKGVATQCLWKQRRAMKSNKASNLDCLTKQLKINDEIIALNQPSINMEASLKIKFSQLPKRVHIFVKQDSDPHFNTFCVHDVPILFSELFKMFKTEVNSVNVSAGTSEYNKDTQKYEIDENKVDERVGSRQAGTSKNNEDTQKSNEHFKNKVDERVGSKPEAPSENWDIPKPKSDCTSQHDSSPENPPSKMFKTQ